MTDSIIFLNYLILLQTHISVELLHFIASKRRNYHVYPTKPKVCKRNTSFFDKQTKQIIGAVRCPPIQPDSYISENNKHAHAAQLNAN